MLSAHFTAPQRKLPPSRHTTKGIEVNCAGMIAEYRGSSGAAIRIGEILKGGQNRHYAQAEILEVSTGSERVLRESSSVGITPCKKHRMYVRLFRGAKQG